MNHKEGKFKGQNNLDIYYQSWHPCEIPKSILLVAHGLAEHSGRYINLVNYFVPEGYTIYALDHQGHGKSEGLSGYVNSFSDYINDLKTFFDLIRKENETAKVFLVGHSMGGLIAVKYTVEHQKDLAGLILSSPTLKVGSSVSSRDIIIARIVAKLFPKTGIAGLDYSAISRDKRVIDSYIHDPLVYTGKIRARLACELIKAMVHRLPSEMSKIKLPVLIMQGSLDSLSNPEGSRLLFKLVKSKDKTFKVFEGLYHEVFNEPEHPQILSYMETWLNSHL
jgi:alpha-beta hydrolase superfamily lysophospholipase